MWRPACFILVLALALPACTGPRVPGAAGSENMITAEQIDASNAGDLYQLINRIRPQWLSARGQGITNCRTGAGGEVCDASQMTAGVFFAGSPVGGIEYLRSIELVSVGGVRYWPTAEATARFGMGYPNGVIEVSPRGATR